MRAIAVGPSGSEGLGAKKRAALLPVAVSIQRLRHEKLRAGDFPLDDDGHATIQAAQLEGAFYSVVRTAAQAVARVDARRKPLRLSDDLAEQNHIAAMIGRLPFSIVRHKPYEQGDRGCRRGIGNGTHDVHRRNNYSARLIPAAILYLAIDFHSFDGHARRRISGLIEANRWRSLDHKVCWRAAIFDVSDN